MNQNVGSGVRDKYSNKQYQLLQERELYFWQIYERVSNGILLQTLDGSIIYANTAACNLLGLTIKQLLGLTPVDPGWFARYEDGLPFSWEDLSKAARLTMGVPLKSRDIMVSAPSQDRRWLIIQTTPIVNQNTGFGEEILITLINNTAYKHIEICALLIREIGHRILIEQSLRQTYQYLCEQFVNTLGYSGAWIGAKETDGTVSFQASAGVITDYINQIKIHWDHTPEGQCAVGQCIRTGKTQVYNLQSNPQFKVWSPFIEDSKLQSVVALPLKYLGQTLGVLVLYSYQPDFFNEQIISQLEHFTLQIAIALTATNHREQLNHYRLLAEHSRDIMLFIDPDGRILEGNLAAIQAYGYTREELLTLRINNLRAPEVTADEQQQIENAIAHGILYETIHCRKDGSSFPVEASSQELLLDKGPVFLRIVRDISERRKVQISLKKSEDRYREIIEHTSNAVVVFEVGGLAENFIFKEFNHAAEIIEKRLRENVLGKSLFAVFPDLVNLEIIDVLRRVWLTGQPEHYPLTFYKEKRIKSWRDNYICRLPSGELAVIYADVTLRKQAEEAVWLEKERAQVTLQSIGDAVITTDVFGSIKYLNPVAEKLTGWSGSEAKGLPLLKVFKIINEITGKTADNPVDRCIRENGIIGLVGHTLLIHRDGYPIAIEDSAAPIRDRQGKIIGAVLVFHDVSDKRSLLHQLSHLAHHDALTGLPNRLLFNDRLSQALAQAHRNKIMVAVFFLDLDRFKLINDTLGHALGDLLLQAVAVRLRECLREGDTVARQGGDEFLIIIPELKQTENAALVAEKILDNFSEPFLLEQHEVYISPSIGISIYPTGGNTIDTLVKNADIAMYYAKEQGGNNYQFFSQISRIPSFERLSLENSLRKALEKEEFLIYYQPQVDLKSGRTIGMEALLRWNSPKNGLVSPAQFIPIAEETGLIVPIGEWVLRTACRQNQAWQKAGYPPLKVSVNLSSRQFRQPDFVSTISLILQESGLSPQWLELEITESIAMENVEFAISMLRELKEMGIHISIDDFGIGFSSLNYLRRLPIDTLKIDRSFIEDITPTLNKTELVTAIIQLAQNLNLNVIAEGVETQHQLDFLRQKGCDEMQGFLFSKPLPGKEFEALLATM